MTTDWIQTYSGRAYYPLAPRIQDVCETDLAHHLSINNRFTGATRKPYSVGEHCYRGARALREILQAKGCDSSIVAAVTLAFLLHDGSEAYLLDIARPVKHSGVMVEYRRIERINQNVVNRWAGLQDLADEHPWVKRMDDVMLATEKRDLMAKTTKPWQGLPPPLYERINPHRWSTVKTKYRDLLDELLPVVREGFNKDAFWNFPAEW